ncbi:hypothetical protein [Methylobacterium nigriterrae]|uniref:hypothetical protein n=1 Tax=Methylobacterium nigriterrae TaxID=3127512 RepID=UPI003013B798
MNAITPTHDVNGLSREELREIVRLLNRYGIAKFGDEWGPRGANPWLTGGERLEELLDKLDRIG